MMDFVLKMMHFILKMLDFILQMEIGTCGLQKEPPCLYHEMMDFVLNKDGVSYEIRAGLLEADIPGEK